ncbi:methyltransferase domain-containing protein [uncultured Acetatifactor sp.]|uniref:methyltransferase domain-containing protein n=1 Tax=uncultured Acetatifactor sp. TaxID=1671927 RepID=UPI00262EC7C7|nr:methyltransferase domain-containing protein [uncultured Acetatifactor sp.]
MPGLEIKEYLSRIGIRRIKELDTALIEAFGREEGERHIGRLTELFDRSEERLLYGAGDTVYLHRQEELVDYWNQSLQTSLLAASFYDRVFFRRAMEYLAEHGSFWSGEIFDMGCGNGILTCFLALRHPDSAVTGLELSSNAISVAKELAGELAVDNVQFSKPDALGQRKCDTLFSCRTAHENVAWRALCEEAGMPSPSPEEQVRLHGQYAKELSALVRPGGHLVSVERYEEDSAYAGLVRALELAGFCQVKGTHMQFSCRNGDGTATFQAMVLRKNA